jgi:hypothetical protein
MKDTDLAGDFRRVHVLLIGRFRKLQEIPGCKRMGVTVWHRNPTMPIGVPEMGSGLLLSK